MAEIRNYTINFGFGRASRLTFAALTLACAEIDLRRNDVAVVGFDQKTPAQQVLRQFTERRAFIESSLRRVTPVHDFRPVPTPLGQPSDTAKDVPR